MNIAYQGQNSLRIRAVCKVDITAAGTTTIQYKKPDGTTGSWSAEVESATLGIIYYDFVLITETALAGTWTYWSYVAFSDGRVAYGDPNEFTIRVVGSMS